MASRTSALRRLAKEYKELQTTAEEFYLASPTDADDLFEWDVLLRGPPDSVYEGGLFRALLRFPSDYPLSPPTMRFSPPLLHPNLYPDGRVCISILHQPGDDPTGYEDAGERWSPVQSIEKIILSVYSVIAAPNLESPADVDAAKLYRDDPEGFARAVMLHIRANLDV